MSELTATIRLRRAEFQLDVELACPPGITCVMPKMSTDITNRMKAMASSRWAT